MSKESTLQVINQSINVLMDYVRNSRKPISKVRPRDLVVLHYIHCSNSQGMITMSQLANFIHVTPAAVSQIVSGYEKHGWVERVRSLEDRRTVYVKVTDAVHDCMQEKWNQHQAEILDFLEEIGPDDCENLERILKKIIKHIEEKENA